MTNYKIAFLGFGNVGQALSRLLLQKRDLLKSAYDLSFSVTGVATARHGMAVNPRGIDLERALELSTAKAQLDVLSSHSPFIGPEEFICSCGADVLFENIPVSYTDGQPAVDFLRLALKDGMHVISANKGPVVHAYQELIQLAREQGRKYYFESAVMDGAPIFSLFRESLPAVRLQRFSGILNSTTNLILTRMEGGESLDQAVAYAQAIGIAETDSSGDIDGWDAAVKVAALVTVLMDTPLKPAQVQRTGIRDLNSADIHHASSIGKRWKLVCTAQREGNKVIGRVSPEMVTADSPLYGVNGTSSMVTFETDVLPALSIVEGNPGTDTTAYGLLADFINIARGK